MLSRRSNPTMGTMRRDGMLNNHEPPTTVSWFVAVSRILKGESAKQRRRKDGKAFWTSTMASNGEGTATAAAATALVPSQLSAKNRPRKKKSNNKKNNLQQQGNQQQQDSPPAPPSNATSGALGDESKPPGSRQQKNRRNNNRHRNKNKKNNKGGDDQQQLQQQKAEGEGQQQQQKKAQTTSKQQQNRRRRNNKRGKRYPWRRHIPAGTVDPITLESLASLEYPPFAIVNSAPYEPVKVWPVPEGQSEKVEDKVDVEELNRRRIEEQWGGNSIATDQKKTDGGDNDADSSENDQKDKQRHYHLYDGRALAYYVVSQLQFIDPLNRRDLTREELANLDDYLKRHGFTDINVTEAYDAKGITLSSAGAAASTSHGRAQILQQMAQVLLNSLFGGQVGDYPPQPTSRSSSDAGPTPSAAPSSLQDQYAELQRREQMQAQQRQDRQGDHEASPYGTGYYASEDGGLIIIDDDDNPGMRGAAAARPGTGPQSGFNGAGSLYSATHIANRYGQGNVVQAASFPALPTRPTSDTAANSQAAAPAPTKAKPKAPPKPSKTLARISGAIKKTTPEEAQRQWEAREEARKRAMMANLSFGENPSATLLAMQSSGQSDTVRNASVSGATTVSEGQIQRNRALADALGVAPATMRQYNSGWARPAGGQIALDEFGNELNAALYPDSLIMQARERMGLVEKVEKKWKNFLSDDSSASMPLNPMDRPSRTFVHEYSDYWKLRTESFDPEPKRYIHCVKMLDTHTPHPLLSDAARNWRGPTQLPRMPAASAALAISDHPTQQTAGQSASSREIPPPPDRVPLPLKPRSVVVSLGDGGLSGTGKTGKDIRAVETQSSSDATATSSRFGSLFTGRERPKLELTKRTVPLVSC